MQKTRTIILSYILLELSRLITFHKRWFPLSCVGVQVVFDYKTQYKRHLGSIPRFQGYLYFLKVDKKYLSLVSSMLAREVLQQHVRYWKQS